MTIVRTIYVAIFFIIGIFVGVAFSSYTAFREMGEDYSIQDVIGLSIYIVLSLFR